MAVRISVVEENDELRASLVALLKGAPGLHCVGSHGNAREALQKIPLEYPDVVLMDVHLQDISGVECMTRLKSRVPGLRILMLARYEHSDAGFDSIRAGASGYLLKHAPAGEMIEAIEHVHAGGATMTMRIARKVIDHVCKKGKSKGLKLTSREQEIIELIGKGYSHKEIGEMLGISEGTSKSQLARAKAILQKKVAQYLSQTQKSFIR